MTLGEQFRRVWKRVDDGLPALRRLLLRGKVGVVPCADYKKRNIVLVRSCYGLDTLKAVDE